jgi:hypothetical protein
MFVSGPRMPSFRPVMLGIVCIATDECLMFIKWEGKRDAMPGSPPK